MLTYLIDFFFSITAFLVCQNLYRIFKSVAFDQEEQGFFSARSYEEPRKINFNTVLTCIKRAGRTSILFAVLAILIATYLVYLIINWFAPNTVRALMRDLKTPVKEDDDRRDNKLLSKPAEPNCLSPININTHKVVKMNVQEGSENLKWEHHNESPKCLTLFNDGVTAAICGQWNHTPRISGAAIGSLVYEFSLMTFIWGMKDDSGSEHALDGKKYPMELQMIYEENGDSGGRGDVGYKNLVVIAIFLEFDSPGKKFMSTVTKGLGKVTEAYERTQITSFPLAEVIREFTKDFYLYHGTYALNEKAIYIVPKQTISINKQQIKAFRKLADACCIPICSNQRSIQENQPRVELY